MVRCPICLEAAPRSTYPSKSSKGLDVESLENIDWWCSTCLAARIAMAHADDCRCRGCAGHAAPDYLWTIVLILFIVVLLRYLGAI